VLDRRQFLRLAVAAGLSPLACVSGRARGAWVNDIHSALNRTYVAEILQPRSLGELQSLIQRSSRERRAVCLAGGRHAMGGQQFASNANLFDMRRMNRVLGLDREQGLVEVESGVQWPELISRLTAVQSGEERQWGIRQKQTGADRLTVGGALAANAHGRGLTFQPIVQDIESFVLVRPSGESIRCSRSENGELFRLAIGGYGLFGAVSSVTLRLAPRQKLERVVTVRETGGLIEAFDERIRSGFLYGDFQFSIDEASENYLRRGIFSCYRPVDVRTPVATTQRELRDADWRDLISLAHVNKAEAYERYADYYLTTSGQIYWSDEHQLSTYFDDYHQLLDQHLKASVPASEIITELYVPRPALTGFLEAVRADFLEHRVNLIYGTIRLIERDDETFLAWAKQPYACVIFNLHTEHSEDGIAASAAAFRRLIDLALARGGSYFLTYHRYATRNQVERAYPEFATFLEKKRTYDPGELFQSEWHRHYESMFG
jgi:FAD/FMN-containing dehydrogenase